MITGRHRSLVVMVGLALICSTASAETPGEHFRKAMEKKAEILRDAQDRSGESALRYFETQTGRPISNRRRSLRPLY